MFTKSDTERKLDAEINAALDELKDHGRDSDEYAKILEHIAKLHKMKAEESPQKISPDTMLMVTANLVGILAILGHEHVGPVTSKALSFVIKTR